MSSSQEDITLEGPQRGWDPWFSVEEKLALTHSHLSNFFKVKPLGTLIFPHDSSNNFLYIWQLFWSLKWPAYHQLTHNFQVVGPSHFPKHLQFSQMQLPPNRLTGRMTWRKPRVVKHFSLLIPSHWIRLWISKPINIQASNKNHNINHKELKSLFWNKYFEWRWYSKQN